MLRELDRYFALDGGLHPPAKRKVFTGGRMLGLDDFSAGLSLLLIYSFKFMSTF